MVSGRPSSGSSPGSGGRSPVSPGGGCSWVGTSTLPRARPGGSVPGSGGGGGGSGTALSGSGGAWASACGSSGPRLGLGLDLGRGRRRLGVLGEGLLLGDQLLERLGGRGRARPRARRRGAPGPGSRPARAARPAPESGSAARRWPDRRSPAPPPGPGPRAVAARARARGRRAGRPPAPRRAQGAAGCRAAHRWVEAPRHRPGASAPRSQRPPRRAHRCRARPQRRGRADRPGRRLRPRSPATRRRGSRACASDRGVRGSRRRVCPWMRGICPPRRVHSLGAAPVM